VFGVAVRSFAMPKNIFSFVDKRVPVNHSFIMEDVELLILWCFILLLGANSKRFAMHCVMTRCETSSLIKAEHSSSVVLIYSGTIISKFNKFVIPVL
jgi:hypothetical protein